MFVKLFTNAGTCTRCPALKFSPGTEEGWLTHGHLCEGQEGDVAWIRWTERLAPGSSRRDQLSAKTNKQQKKRGEVKTELFSGFCCKQRGWLIFQKSLIGRALMRCLCSSVLCRLSHPSRRLPSPVKHRCSAADTRVWRRLNYCDAGLNQQGLRGASSAENINACLD